jgi:hypothetical protein
MTGDRGVFTTPAIASVDPLERYFSWDPGFTRKHERGRCRPTTLGADRTSDTPVASSSFRPRSSRLRVPVGARGKRQDHVDAGP